MNNDSMQIADQLEKSLDRNGTASLEAFQNELSPQEQRAVLDRIKKDAQAEGNKVVLETGKDGKMYLKFD